MDILVHQSIPGSFFASKQSSNARFEARSLASPVALDGGTEAEAFQPYQGVPGSWEDLQTYWGLKSYIPGRGICVFVYTYIIYIQCK